MAYYPDEPSKKRLILPDISKSHWRPAYVKGQLRYFYHTFYPQQLDLNWQNPQVLYEMLDVLGYWANQGVDIFRLDAIPFLVKKAGIPAENQPGTHAIIRILSAFLQASAPCSVLQAEACQGAKDILPYYGKEQEQSISLPSGQVKPLTRTDEVQIAYHFPLMPAIWASLLTHRSEHFWKAYRATPNIPTSAAWSIFLRLHDELTLEMVDPATRKTLYTELSRSGASFREGVGVSGRLANFLENDPKRINLIYSILFSLPGIPILYYGDEIKAQNNTEFMAAAAESKKHILSTLNIMKTKNITDTRDIARAPISEEHFLQAMRNPFTAEGQIYKQIKELIRLRHQEKALSVGSLSPIKASHPSILSYSREYLGRKLLIIHNLSNLEIKYTIPLPQMASARSYLRDLKTQEKLSLNNKGFELSLQPYQSRWFVLEKIPFSFITGL